jgi:hypothetical protein
LGLSDPASGRWVDLTHYLAAWVTPNAPPVMKLLREAARCHPEGRIIGYQGGPEVVEAQVRAVFEALKALGIQYVNSVLTFGADRGVDAAYSLPKRGARKSIRQLSTGPC